MSLDLQDDKWCYVCGEHNPVGLRLSFNHPEPGLLTSQAVFQKQHQGFKNIVHGGLVGTVLDEMMVNLALVEGTPAVTGSYTLRLKKPVKVGEGVLLEGRIDRRTPRLIYASARMLEALSGDLLAEAKAVCVRIKTAVRSEQTDDAKHRSPNLK